MNIANPYASDVNPEERHYAKLRRWASIASLSVASVLIAAKFIAYIITDSVSMMTSLVDSIFDAIASAVTMFSVIHATAPADKEHRFGHGKIEALAAAGQALFILAAAGYLIFESLRRFVTPHAVREVSVGIGVMVLSIALTVALIVFQRHVIKRTKSVAISADHLHYKGDLYMNVSVLAALCLGHYSNWPYFDPLFALLISLVLLYSARAIAKESFDILMDKELPDEDRTMIENLVRAHPQVRGVHDLRTRYSGRQAFIEFHLELDGGLSLTKAHDITEELELILYRAFPQSEVLMHQEPAGIDDHRLDDKIKTG